MEKHAQTQIIAKYNGHAVKANQSVDLNVKCGYDQLPEYIQLIQFLNNDVTIFAKLPDVKPMKLGTFRVQNLNISHDGEGSIKFNSMNDFVNTDNFNKLVGSEMIVMRVSADIEIEDSDEEEEE